MQDRILVIDDDVELLELLVDYLADEGFTVETSADPVAGLERARAEPFGLIVLDVMLPRLSGFEVLRALRESSKTPVIMLTARGDEVDRIVGLEMGADDYLPKPFNPRELVARIKAILRRTGETQASPEAAEGPGAPPSSLVVGDVELIPSLRQVRQEGRPVEFTSVEFAVLEQLLSHAGSPVSREELSVKALGRKLTAYDRSIDVHVSSIRKKLGHKVGEAERIVNVRGVGYLYAHQPEGT